MTPEHEARREAIAALPFAAREALWALDVPGWAYWLEGSECETCDGITHHRCDDCDALIDVHRGDGDGDWHYHCTCGEDWPCTEPRCAACGGTGFGPKEWTHDGLGRPGGTAAYVHKTDPEAVLFCPYSALDVLMAAGSFRPGGTYSTVQLRNKPPHAVFLSDDVPNYVPASEDARGFVATNADPLLAALDVLRQVTVREG
jgi:hypothetical protein